MQVTETLSQGLKREYDISLPASDLAEKLNGQLADLKAKVQINGFRPGKVPVEHLRKVYGKSVMADVVQEAIASANKKIVDDNHLRLAREPKVELPTDQSAIDAALEARGDLNFKVALEVLPVFEIGDFSQISLERPDRRRRGRRRRDARSTGSPRSAAPTPRSPRAPRRKLTTASPSISTARSTAFRSRAARAGTSRWCWARTPSFPASRSSSSASRPARSARFTATFPETYAVRALAGQDGRFRRDGEGGRRARAARHRRRIRQGSRLREPRQAQGDDPRPDRRLNTPAPRATRSSASCSTSSTSSIPSSCPRGWSTRSSTRSGSR